jgi:hypothetical protein
VREVHRISWRKFLILLGGLTDSSATVRVNANKNKPIEDPDQAEKQVMKAWSLEE